MVPRWLRVLLELLLRNYGFILALMMVIGYGSVDVFNDGPDRGRGAIGHTVGVLDILGLLI